ncbi:MAG: hypothetical protein AAF639_06790, partial [Chloroflexota bacterium]
MTTSPRGGHYITVWAPRQTGKSWTTRQVIKQVRAEGAFEIGVISLQSAKTINDEQSVLELFVDRLGQSFRRDFPVIQKWTQISSLFTSDYFSKPVILVVDEFDALQEGFINRFANEFRDMYLRRIDEDDVPSEEKSNLLRKKRLDEFQNIANFVYRDEALQGKPDESMLGSFHSLSESKMAPMLVTSSYLGILLDIMADYLEASRLSIFRMKPALEPKHGLEAVHRYAQAYGEPVNDKTASQINELCMADPFLISCVISSEFDDKDLTKKNGEQPYHSG